MTEVEEVPDHCSDECEYRWGRNCAAHWIDVPFDKIVNDVAVLNELAKDRSVEVWERREEGGALDLMILIVGSMKYLITDYRGLEVSVSLNQGNAIHLSRQIFKFSRSATKE